MFDIKHSERVICIDDHFRDERCNPFSVSDLKLPVEGEVYTVRDIVETERFGKGLYLEGLHNKKFYYSSERAQLEPPFSINRFVRSE